MDIVDILMFVLSLGLMGAAIFGGVYFVQQKGVLNIMLASVFFLVAAVCLYAAGRGGIYLWKKFRPPAGPPVQNPLAAANAATAQATQNAARLRAELEAAGTRALNNGTAAANVVRVNMPTANNGTYIAVPTLRPPPPPPLQR